jgi:hypothetical protein
MGHYTSIRFKGYVKPEYRKDFYNIAISGEWENSNVKQFKKFGEKYESASFIPRGICYVDDWFEQPYEPDHKPIDGFERSYNVETGYWTFLCSLKNYDNTVDVFQKLIPLFIEKIDYFECHIDIFESSNLYTLNEKGDDLIISGLKNYNRYRGVFDD